MSPYLDNGYDDRDTYTSTPEAAAASADYHAVDDLDMPTLDELSTALDIFERDFYDGVDTLADHFDSTRKD